MDNPIISRRKMIAGGLGAVAALSASRASMATGVGDDITATLQAALDSTGIAYVPATASYHTVSSLVVPAGATLSGDGYCSILRSSSNAPILTLGDDASIVGIRLLGTGKGATVDAGQSRQHGIVLDGALRCSIDRVWAEDLGGCVLMARNTLGEHEGNRVSQVVAWHCNVGFWAAARGEYLSCDGFRAIGCNIGGQIQAGNFHGSDLDLSGCSVGLQLLAGANDSHGLIEGSAFNHSSAYALQADGIQNGFSFMNCNLYDGDIWLRNTRGVRWDGGHLDWRNCYFEGSIATTIRATMPRGYGNTIFNSFRGNASQTFWEGCRDLNGASWPV